jgi:hypothetical protein
VGRQGDAAVGARTTRAVEARPQPTSGVPEWVERRMPLCVAKDQGPASRRRRSRAHRAWARGRVSLVPAERNARLDDSLDRQSAASSRMRRRAAGRDARRLAMPARRDGQRAVEAAHKRVPRSTLRLLSAKEATCRWAGSVLVVHPGARSDRFRLAVRSDPSQGLPVQRPLDADSRKQSVQDPLGPSQPATSRAPSRLSCHGRNGRAGNVAPNTRGCPRTQQVVDQNELRQLAF